MLSKSNQGDHIKLKYLWIVQSQIPSLKTCNGTRVPLPQSRHRQFFSSPTSGHQPLESTVRYQSNRLTEETPQEREPPIQYRIPFQLTEIGYLRMLSQHRTTCTPTQFWAEEMTDVMTDVMHHLLLVA
jgi:hypothetical protein